MSNVLAVANPVQAVLAAHVIKQMTGKGHLATRRGLVAEDFTSATIKVAKDEKAQGQNFDSKVENFDLMNPAVRDVVVPAALKELHKKGVEITEREVKSNLFDLMWIMGSKQGQPNRRSRIGEFGEGSIGRPAADAKPAAKAKTKAKVTTRAKGKKAGAKKATAHKPNKVAEAA